MPQAQLFDGTVLDFEDGTPDEVIGKVAKRETDRIRTEQARQPLPEGVQPSTARGRSGGQGGPSATDFAAEDARRSLKRDAAADLIAAPQQMGSTPEEIAPAAPEEPTRPIITRDPLARPAPGFTPGRADLEQQSLTDDTRRAQAVQRGYGARADAAPELRAAPERGPVQRALDATVRKPMDDSLAGLGVEMVGDAARGVVRASQGVAGSALSGGQAAFEAVGAGDTRAAAVLAEGGKAARGARTQMGNPADANSLTQQVFESTFTSLPMALAFGGGGALTAMGAQAAANDYGESRDRGLAHGAALERSVYMGLTEILGERLSLPQLQRLFAQAASKATGKEMGKTLADLLVKEQVGEQATQALQSAYEKFGVSGTKPNMTLQDYITDAAETAKVTLGQSLLTGGMAAGARKVAAAYDTANSKGFYIDEPPLTTDEPKVQRSKTVTIFEGMATRYGMESGVVQRAKQAIATMPPQDVGPFLARLTGALQARGLVAKPVDAHALEALAAGPTLPPFTAEDEQRAMAAFEDQAKKDYAGLRDFSRPRAETQTDQSQEVERETSAESVGARQQPTEPDLQEPLDTDVRTKAGNPFATERSAQRVLKDHPGAEVVPVLGGYVVRRPGASPARAAEQTGAVELAPGITAAAPIDHAAHEAAPSPANDRPEPTDAQKEAGNYQLGHHRIAGLDVSIENPQGSVRRSKADSPVKWETTMAHHYGYIRGSVGMDGDHIDTFIKPGTPDDFSGTVFVVDQIDPKTGKDDEHKVMMGFDSLDEARAAYAANYSKGWKGMKAITAAPLDQFKTWLAGDTTKPFAQEPTNAQPTPSPAPVDRRADAGWRADTAGGQGNLAELPPDQPERGAPAAAAPAPRSAAPAPVGSAADGAGAVARAAPDNAPAAAPAPKPSSESVAPAPAAALPPHLAENRHAALRNVIVRLPGTGRRMNAAAAMRAIDARLKALADLKLCIGRI